MTTAARWLLVALKSVSTRSCAYKIVHLLKTYVENERAHGASIWRSPLPRVTSALRCVVEGFFKFSKCVSLQGVSFDHPSYVRFADKKRLRCILLLRLYSTRRQFVESLLRACVSPGATNVALCCWKDFLRFRQVYLALDGEFTKRWNHKATKLLQCGRL